MSQLDGRHVAYLFRSGAVVRDAVLLTDDPGRGNSPIPFSQPHDYLSGYRVVCHVEQGETTTFRDEEFIPPAAGVILSTPLGWQVFYTAIEFALLSGTGDGEMTYFAEQWVRVTQIGESATLNFPEGERYVRSGEFIIHYPNKAPDGWREFIAFANQQELVRERIILLP